MDVKNLVARIKNHIYWEKIEKGYFGFSVPGAEAVQV